MPEDDSQRGANLRRWGPTFGSARPRGRDEGSRPIALRQDRPVAHDDPYWPSRGEASHGVRRLWPTHAEWWAEVYGHLTHWEQLRGFFEPTFLGGHVRHVGITCAQCGSDDRVGYDAILEDYRWFANEQFAHLLPVVMTFGGGVLNHREQDVTLTPVERAYIQRWQDWRLQRASRALPATIAFDTETYEGTSPEPGWWPIQALAVAMAPVRQDETLPFTRFPLAGFTRESAREFQAPSVNYLSTPTVVAPNPTLEVDGARQEFGIGSSWDELMANFSRVADRREPGAPRKNRYASKDTPEPLPSASWTRLRRRP